MGMYDNVKVQYPLPDGHDPTDEEYQTKDTPSQYLKKYVLTKDGRLTLDGKDINFHGDLTFYASNVSGCSGAGIVTSDNKPPLFREYTALFKDGQLIDIHGGVTDTYADVKHYTNREEWWADSDRIRKERRFGRDKK